MSENRLGDEGIRVIAQTSRFRLDRRRALRCRSDAFDWVPSVGISRPQGIGPTRGVSGWLSFAL